MTYFSNTAIEEDRARDRNDETGSISTFRKNLHRRALAQSAVARGDCGRRATREVADVQAAPSIRGVSVRGYRHRRALMALSASALVAVICRTAVGDVPVAGRPIFFGQKHRTRLPPLSADSRRLLPGHAAGEAVCPLSCEVGLAVGDPGSRIRGQLLGDPFWPSPGHDGRRTSISASRAACVAVVIGLANAAAGLWRISTTRWHVGAEPSV